MNRHLRKISILLCIVLFCANGSGCSVKDGVENAQTAVVSNSKETQEIGTRDFEMTESQIAEDFEVLMNTVEANYPFLEVNQRLNQTDFLGNREIYQQRLKSVKTAMAFHDVLVDVVKDLHNAHTSIIKNDSKQRRDKFYWCYFDGSEVNSPYKPYYEALSDPRTLRLYGPLPQAYPSESDASTATGSAAKNVEAKMINSGQTAYLKIKSFEYDKEEQDANEVNEFLGTLDNCKTLIIDIRGNRGGSTEYWRNLLVEPLAKEKLTYSYYLLYKDGKCTQNYLDAKFSGFLKDDLRPISELKPKDFPKAKPEVFSEFAFYNRYDEVYEPQNQLKFSGKIYLLTDGKNYSAAEGFASFCKQTKFATIVGEQTGGDGITTDPMFYVLPNSGIIVRQSYSYGMLPSGEANEELKTMPDIIVKSDSSEGDIEKDKSVRKILSMR